MQPASMGFTAASPSASRIITSPAGGVLAARLRTAVLYAADAARIQRACAAVDANAAQALANVREALGVKPRSSKARAALATAESLRIHADDLAKRTAEALGRKDAEDAATRSLVHLARAVFSDRLRMLADGPVWAGSGYCDALADAALKLGGMLREVDVDTLGVDGAALAYVSVEVSTWTGEPCGLTCHARLASRTFDGARVYVPEVDLYGPAAAGMSRRHVEVNLTGASHTGADAPALAEMAHLAACVAEVVGRYVAAHPAVNARTAAEEAVALTLATLADAPSA